MKESVLGAFDLSNMDGFAGSSVPDFIKLDKTIVLE